MIVKFILAIGGLAFALALAWVVALLVVRASRRSSRFPRHAVPTEDTRREQTTSREEPGRSLSPRHIGATTRVAPGADPCQQPTDTTTPSPTPASSGPIATLNEAGLSQTDAAVATAPGDQVPSARLTSPAAQPAHALPRAQELDRPEDTMGDEGKPVPGQANDASRSAASAGVRAATGGDAVAEAASGESLLSAASVGGAAPTGGVVESSIAPPAGVSFRLAGGLPVDKPGEEAVVGFPGSPDGLMPDSQAPPDTFGAMPSTSKEAPSKAFPKRVSSPRQYRPVARAPAVPRGNAPDREARDRALPIEVRLVFEKAGFCRVSLLPRRTSDFPAELDISGSGEPPQLLALQDDWYQDIVLPDIGTLLRRGIEWVGVLEDGRRARWSLSGREIYVLSSHPDLNGFVSTPRLVLGEQQVVLCTVGQQQAVRESIELTGSLLPTVLDGANGMPKGWVGFRGIVPRNPVPHSSGGDILDALRPLAEIEIVLEGGIRIERRTWLTGYPPRIRLSGDVATAGNVVIDGHVALPNADGKYTVSGWDLVGQHQVWSASASCSYSIRDGAEDWPAWDAYSWSLGDLTLDGDRTRPVICGALVMPSRERLEHSPAVVVSTSTPILLGAVPGQIYTCSLRSDVWARTCTGFPLFTPVWAVPDPARRCDKRTDRVVLIADSLPVGERDPHAMASWRVARHVAKPLEAWCSAILTASRKGLSVEPPELGVAALWEEYRRRARAIWRSRR